MVTRLIDRRLVGLLLAAVPAFAALGSASAGAHEIPNDVTVQVLVRPAGDRVQVLLRAPLEAMQDIEFPVTGPGYLEFSNAGRSLRDAAQVWLMSDIEIFENGEPVGEWSLRAARASIPSDRSFQSFDMGLAHVRSPPLPDGTPLVWQQALLDVLIEAPIRSAASDFAIATSFERLGLAVVTVIRYLSSDGVDRIFEVAGNSGFQPLDPGALQAAFRFLVQGFEHILDGTDHLLFLLCLVMPFYRRIKPLVWIVTSFTVAHSVTLIGSAYGLAPDALWFPPLIETLIAASILYMAIENALGPKLALRWGIAFGFGLIHGFGFSFALRNTLQFAGDHVLTALLAFNVGVELGQILVLLVLVGALRLLFSYVGNQRIAILLVSVFVGHTAWHWLIERYAAWREFNLAWSDLFEALLSGPIVWLVAGLLVVVLGAAGWRRWSALARS
jgi:hypothetical protein